MLQMFIDWYVKAETVFKEVRVGFPEMLKQHILAVGHDVGVFITTHGMVLALAVATAFTIGLVAYLATRLRNSKRELELSEWATIRHLDNVKFWRNQWKVKHNCVVELVDTHDELVSRNNELEERNTELSGMNSDLNEKVDEMQVTIDELGLEITDLKDENESLDTRNDELISDIAETNGNLFRAEEERDGFENELEELRNKFDTSTKLVGMLK